MCIIAFRLITWTKSDGRLNQHLHRGAGGIEIGKGVVWGGESPRAKGLVRKDGVLFATCGFRLKGRRLWLERMALS